jgi:peptidoglycan/xylan/chitin deacetylase (PgdA/CDA1 family)
MALRPDLIRRTLAEGHEIANHSQNHQRLDGLSDRERHREINDADITFYRLTGQHFTLMRPPGMRYNAEVIAENHRLGYLLIGYTTASRDFNLDETPEFIARRTVRRTEAGSILLLHDYPATVQALPTILRQLKAQGYRFVTISEMIAHLPEKARQALRSD